MSYQIKPGGLWIGLYFPQLPIEIFTRSEGKEEQRPAVVTTRNRVCHINAAAEAFGIRVGSSVDTASTLVEQIVVCNRDEAKEQRMLRHLAQWAYQFTSHVSLKPPLGLLLEAGASLKLFGGIQNITGRLQGGLAGLGFTAAMSVHHTPLAAMTCARAGLPHMTPPEKMPVSALGVEARIIEALQKTGVRSVAEVLALPPAGLSRRFGADFMDHLQRLTGNAADPQRYIGEKPVFVSEINFLSDITDTSALIFPVHRLLQEFHEFLMTRQLRISAFEFRLAHRHHPPREITVTLAEPENDLSLFRLLIQLQLDKVRDVPEVDSVRLSAHRFVSSESVSGDLFHGTRFQQSDGRSGALADRENGLRLINMLHTRLGAQACFGLALANDHRPEKAWTQVPVHQRRDRSLPDMSDESIKRPAFLLRKPYRLQTRDNRPWGNGALTLLAGPERIDFGWWDGDAHVSRDYFIARHSNGALYWLYQEQQSHDWYLHGIFS